MQGKVYHYSAFISYSHVDVKFATWLQREIERFRVPGHLTRKRAAGDALPKKLRPVFRDRDELSSGHSLTDKIRQALEDSEFLIVVCSPDGAYSHWVNEEILAFQAMGRGDDILALIVKGQPNASDAGLLHLECFPKALRYGDRPGGGEAVKLPEPMAADLRPEGDGVRNAAIKIIAGMLGVGFDDLAQRTAKRRRRQMATAAGLAGIAAVMSGYVGLRYIDYDGTKVEYYREFTTRYGVPTGVGRLTPGEAGHRHRVFVIARRHGDIIELRQENSRKLRLDLTDDRDGLAAEYNQIASIAVESQAPTGFLTYLLDFRPRPQKALRLDLRDLGGNVLRSELFEQRNGGEAVATFRTPRGTPRQVYAEDVRPVSFLSNEGDTGPTRISQLRISYGAGGLVAGITFEDSSGEAVASPDALTGFTYAYDTRGLLTMTRNVFPAGKDMASEAVDNIVAVRKSYSREGDLNAVAWLNKNNHPVLNQHSYAIMNIKIDRYGNYIKKEFLDQYYSHTGINYGRVASDVVKYDAYGNKIFDAYYDRYGKATEDKGYHSSSTIFYANGLEKCDNYFGVNRLPVSTAWGYAKICYTYNRLGQVTSERYYRPNGKPVHIDPVKTKPGSGYSGVLYSYDPQGHLTRQIYIDDNGHPALRSNPIAEMRWAYDAFGHVSKWSSYGSKGELTADSDGVAIETYKSSFTGQQLEFRTFGADGKPIVNRESGCFFREMLWAYSQREMDACYDTEHRLIANTDGVARAVHVYDGRGNEVEKVSYDVSGHPTVGRTDGFARRVRDYDRAGRLIQVQTFDNDNRLVNIDGAAQTRYDYDPRGNEISRRYFDAMGNGVNGLDGCAQKTQAFDIRGNLTRVFCRDGAGRPAVPTGTIAYHPGNSGIDPRKASEVEFVYDRNNFVSDIAIFDTAGRPRDGGNGVARVHWLRDAYGRPVEIAYFDKANKPIVYSTLVGWNTRFASAVTRYAYDTHGNRVETRWFDATGKPSSDNDLGCVAIFDRYDDHSRVVEETCQGADGQPVPGRYGYATVRYAYDKADNLISIVHVDGLGKLTADHKGVSRVLFTQDSTGQVVAMRYVDALGRPIADRSGICMVTADQDRQGHIIAKRYLDCSQKPKGDEEGIAAELYTYNDDGKVKSTITVGVDGLRKAGYGYAQMLFDYDDQGRMVSEIEKDADGKDVHGIYLNFEGTNSWATSSKAVWSNGKIDDDYGVSSIGYSVGIDYHEDLYATLEMN